MVPEAAHKISLKKTTTAEQLLAELEPIVPKDTQFQERFAVATVSNAKLARYYIRSLETAWKQEPHPLYLPNDDPGVVNLEHVLPRRPDGNWPQFSDEEAEALHRRLGNLALLNAKGNSDLKSAGFDEKKKVFATTPYELTKQIATLTQWTPIEINERQKKMAELAVRTWPLSAA